MHGLVILPGRIEAGISNRGTFVLLQPVEEEREACVREESVHQPSNPKNLQSSGKAIERIFGREKDKHDLRQARHQCQNDPSGTGGTNFFS